MTYSPRVVLSIDKNNIFCIEMFEIWLYLQNKINDEILSQLLQNWLTSKHSIFFSKTLKPEIRWVDNTIQRCTCASIAQPIHWYILNILFSLKSDWRYVIVLSFCLSKTITFIKSRKTSNLSHIWLLPSNGVFGGPAITTFSNNSASLI